MTLSALLNQHLEISSVTPGGDEARDWQVSIASVHRMQFGKEVIFTHGPLSQLIDRCVDVGNLLVSALVGNLVLNLLMGAAALGFVVALPGLSGTHRILIALVVLFSMQLPGPRTEDQLRALNLCLILTSLLKPRWLIVLGVGGALCAVFSLIKASLGVSALGALVIGSALARPISVSATRLTASLGAFSATLIVLWLLLGQSIENLPGYFSGMSEILAAYPHTLSMGVSRWDQMVIGYLIFLLLVYIWLARIGRPLGYPLGIALAFPLFTSFKHSIVRMGPAHIMHFVHLAQFAVVSISAISIAQRRPTKRTVGIFTGLALFLLHVSPLLTGWRSVLHANRTTLFQKALERLVSTPVRTAAELRALARLEEARTRARYETEQALAGVVLPEAARKLIGDSTLDVWSFDPVHLPANGFRWRPRPSLTPIIAGTPRLDAIDAAFLASRRAPDFIIIDRALHPNHPEHLFYYEPLAFRELMNRYDYNSRYGEVYLLKRRNEPRFGAPISLGSPLARSGEKVRVPDVPGRAALFLSVEMRPSAWLRIEAFLFKPRPWYLKLFRPGEPELFYRLYPNAVHGVPVHPLPTESPDLEHSFGAWRRPPTEIAIEIPGEESGSAARLEWFLCPARPDHEAGSAAL